MKYIQHVNKQSTLNKKSAHPSPNALHIHKHTWLGYEVAILSLKYSSFVTGRWKSNHFTQVMAKCEIF